VVATINANVANVQRLLESALGAVARRTRDCRCSHALSGAIVTVPKAMNKRTLAKLKLLIGHRL
jgi:hypothetical protein